MDKREERRIWQEVFRAAKTPVPPPQKENSRAPENPKSAPEDLRRKAA